MRLHDGDLSWIWHYLLRNNLTSTDPKLPWQMYILLVEIEAVFRNFQSALGIRPVYHQLGRRVDARSHVTRKHWLRKLAPGLAHRQGLDQLAKVQMIDMEFPTTDGRKLALSRYTQPDAAVKLLLAGMGKCFPEQPPPQIREGKPI